MKTFYLWDLAVTLFPEPWQAQRSNFASYHDYLRSLGHDAETVDPLTYESAYRVPYSEGWFDLVLNDGFAEVLTWTVNNAAFTSGVPEQLEWRAVYLQKKYGLDVRQFFQKVYSTFDYGNTNVKTQSMFADLIRQIFSQGFRAIVYTDDNLDNCRVFNRAAAQMNVSHRTYHMVNDSVGLRFQTSYFVIGSLRDLQRNEQKLRQK